MGVVIESDRWELHPSAFLVLFASCFASIFLLPYFSRSISGRGAVASSLFDLGHTAPFLRFQSGFLMLYALASVMQGVESVFGENDFAEYGSSREQMAWYLAMGAFAALIFGTFSGILFDILGARKACLLFCFLHIFLGALKSLIKHPIFWMSNICLSIASSVFSFCYETWMVIEHEKQGHKQDLLNDTFWLMTFFESFSLIGSQGLSNLLVKGVHSRSFNSSALAAILAVLSTLYFKKEWSKSHHATVVGSYKKSFSAHILKDKNILVLMWAQASIHFSMSVFWILWAPTIVADGREVNLSLIYPVLIGSRMLGSTAFPWLFSEAKLLGNEDCLMTAMGVASIALFIVAYDYQEIGVLVLLFCIFHACVGFSLPSLARLRTMYLPNELRGGMITFSLAPANAALLFVLLQGGYHRNLENSTIMALAAFGLLIASGCIYKLRSWRKMSRQNWHNI
ncbi:molybdate-anion transporter-like [Zingiber officinale]|uniref:molybdate-anion transporter-like n=1 Tax=Zingiber officinale TaxID=94328 RepID=UPI001C4A9D5A|nr:molybdate-anion transporter-like [Zingiber officinale]XP_042458762.1 molybdate-anion transporter-like [Zingiber officinale]XP_042458763.1 molybdate-anion transporter-like [Zingiber officinale]